MKKHLMDLLVLSLGLNIVAAYVLYEQEKTTKKYRKGYAKMHVWANVMNEVMENHFQNGGTLDISDELNEKMAAYAIFSKNDML